MKKSLIYLVCLFCLSIGNAQNLKDPTLRGVVDISNLPLSLPSGMIINTDEVKKPIGEIIFQGVLIRGGEHFAFINNKKYKVKDIINKKYKIKEFDKNRIILLNIKTKKIKEIEFDN